MEPGKDLADSMRSRVDQTIDKCNAAFNLAAFERLCRVLYETHDLVVLMRIESKLTRDPPIPPPIGRRIEYPAVKVHLTGNISVRVVGKYSGFDVPPSWWQSGEILQPTARMGMVAPAIHASKVDSLVKEIVRLHDDFATEIFLQTALERIVEEADGEEDSGRNPTPSELIQGSRDAIESWRLHGCDDITTRDCPQLAQAFRALHGAMGSISYFDSFASTRAVSCGLESVDDLPIKDLVELSGRALANWDTAGGLDAALRRNLKGIAAKIKRGEICPPYSRYKQYNPGVSPMWLLSGISVVVRNLWKLKAVPTPTRDFLVRYIRTIKKFVKAKIAEDPDPSNEARIFSATLLEMHKLNRTGDDFEGLVKEREEVMGGVPLSALAYHEVTLEVVKAQSRQLDWILESIHSPDGIAPYNEFLNWRGPPSGKAVLDWIDAVFSEFSDGTSVGSFTHELVKMARKHIDEISVGYSRSGDATSKLKVEVGVLHGLLGSLMRLKEKIEEISSSPLGNIERLSVQTIVDASHLAREAWKEDIDTRGYHAVAKGLYEERERVASALPEGGFGGMLERATADEVQFALVVLRQCRARPFGEVLEELWNAREAKG